MINHRLLLLLFILLSSCKTNINKYNLEKIQSEDIKIAPEYYTGKPDLPSPALTDDGRELVLLKIYNNRYTWFDATAENGEPFDYKKGLYGKGNQLMADEEDFPFLARTGLHSEEELINTKIITGRSVSQITVDGRPWGSSGVGFMADDETIMSVILADNRIVKSLGLTHPDLARPLFHIWNISREFENYSIDTTTGERMQMEAILYNGNEIKLEISGSRGWQESIFNDEMLGSGHIYISRELNKEEQEFLNQNYGNLSEDKYEELNNMLFDIHTGEMVFFYINRYGFYEGHTEYRIDPVAVALIFGLRSIEDIHNAAGGDLYKYFTSPFTENPE
ncbi:MAG: hypothetical protein JW965_07310 [Bacteroidales bacterium]|nr:hypothetical protein [Bacteroidales bacterium]